MSTQTTFVNRWIKRYPFALILLAVAFALSLVLVSLQPSVRLGFTGAGTEARIQRGMEADAARYTAMAEYYKARNESILRGREADAARYTAMAKFYSAWNDGLTRGQAADAARYAAMAEYYAKK